MNDIFYIKTVDNSRVVKEMDFRKNLELGFWLGMAFVLVCVLLLQGWVKVQIRQTGYCIETVRSESDTLLGENHLLMAERAALRSPQRIDWLARANLGMTNPLQQQLIVLDATHTMADQPVLAQAQSADVAIPLKLRATE